jgi:hypothetical protein
MGWNRKAVQTTRCPWSLALADSRTIQWLTAYGLIERWGKWPPGREDPQLLEAMVVIASEHARIEAERLESLKAKRK